MGPVIIAVVLASYALVAGALLPRLMRRRWEDRAPRLAIAVWLAGCASVVISAVLSGLALAVPGAVVGHGLTDLFEACAHVFRVAHAHVSSGGHVLTSAASRWALLGSGLITARTIYCFAAVLVRARRECRRHAGMLTLLGRRDADLDATVLEYDKPAVYCLPGRRGETVITTGALNSLTPQEIAAVLAHERAHLRGRHHLLVTAAEAVARAFPKIPLFVAARVEVARLVELLADDVAARRHPRLDIAAALVRLATGHAPAFALGAGGETAITRVRRMLDPAAPLTRRERLAGLAAVLVLLAGPAAVAAMPGVSVFLAHHCHQLGIF
jgi:Zn-dependent protease with chaperone function